MNVDYEALILYVYLLVPMASSQMTAMTQGNYTEAFAQRSLCAEKLLYAEAFTQKYIYTEELLQRSFTHTSFYTEGP